jgi:hypothetical protein
MLIDAVLYDGETSKEHKVNIQFTSMRRVIIPSHNIDVSLDEVKIKSRLGNTPRVLKFPNAVRCKSRGNDKIDQLLHTLMLRSPKLIR